MPMSAVRTTSAHGLVLLRQLVKKPANYGLARGGSLKTIVEFTAQHPYCVRDAEASAKRMIKECLEGSASGKSKARQIKHRIARQVFRAKEGLAWAEMDHRLGIKSGFWNVGRYCRLAKCLCVLSALQSYLNDRFPKVCNYSSIEATARLAGFCQQRQRGWKALQNHLDHCGVDWQAGVVAHLGRRHASRNGLGPPNAVRRDKQGNLWIVQYGKRSRINSVLASLFARLCGCPGAEICPSFLDYDLRNGRPCFVRPYIKARQVHGIDLFSKKQLINLIAHSRRRCSQTLCQAVTCRILGSNLPNKVIIDAFGNCIFVSDDRSFIINDPRATPGEQAARNAETCFASIPADLIEVSARIPGVLEDLVAFVTRVEEIPPLVYEGIVRNASLSEEHLCNLYDVDTRSAGATITIETLEGWIANLLARRWAVRKALVQQFGEVLGTIPTVLVR
jgi:hypothetical protein